jgi:hypothetical protein
LGLFILGLDLGLVGLGLHGGSALLVAVVRLANDLGRDSRYRLLTFALSGGGLLSPSSSWLNELSRFPSINS